MQVAKKLTRLLRYDEMVFFFFFFTLSNVQIVSFHRFERDFVNVLLNVWSKFTVIIFFKR